MQVPVLPVGQTKLQQFPENFVVYVGDEPSAKNVSQELAFVGTQSYNRLVQWAAEIGRPYVLVNSHTPELIEYCKQTKGKLVALGNKAEIRLMKAGLSCFKLPHPSGRNLVCNDKDAVGEFIEKCKEYLNA